MFRAAFLACGFFVTLCGVAMCFVDRVTLTDYASRHVRRTVGEVAQSDPDAWRLIYAVAQEEKTGDARETIDPPDWAGFCLLSVGGVTLLYSLSLPGKRQEEEEDG